MSTRVLLSLLVSRVLSSGAERPPHAADEDHLRVELLCRSLIDTEWNQ